MKALLSFIIFYSVSLAGNLYAQAREDVIYLNNGSILRGKLNENISGVQSTIEIVGHNTIVVSDSAIKMIMTNQVIPSKDRADKSSPVEMAATVSFFGGSKNSAGCSFITSYRFPSRISVGVGIGNEWFDHQQIPFIADFKYSFLKGMWSPYVFALCGYSIPLSKKVDGDWSEYYGGFLAGTGAGLRFNFTKHNALVFSLGYRYQKTKTVTNSYPWLSSYQGYDTILYNKFNRVTFSLGFLFN